MRPVRHHVSDQCRSAFTLIEMMIVMTLLVIVIAVTMPSLSGFFRGRVLESEGRRLLSLVHAGQDRAISEGVPISLWVDVAQRQYGLEEQSGFTQSDPKQITYTLDKEVKMELPVNQQVNRNDPTAAGNNNNPHRNLPQLRFQPDGTPDDQSVSGIRLVGSDGASLWLTQVRSNRFNYEIRTQPN